MTTFARTTSDLDHSFTGSIPQLYDRYMVPLMFEPYARDLAGRVAERRPTGVLEIAAGTGVVTRRLASTLPPGTSIVATDLSQPMLDHAASVGTTIPVDWRRADVMRLPFDDGTFDVVVCQFGVMFFADKARAFAEARRVLREGGAFAFNVWDRISENEFADTVDRAMQALFAVDPPRFMARVPHGYYDHGTIEGDLRAGGFASKAQFTTVAARSRADSPRIPAVAMCHGTPLRSEIEARGPSCLLEATEAATDAIARRFGPGLVDARMQAHVVVAER